MDDVDFAVETCLSVAGDPRRSKGRWIDIPATTEDTVLRWLTVRTIENMFRVMAEMKVDQPDQVSSRLAFWRGYVPFVRRAYLLCESRAKFIAHQLNEPCGDLGSPDTWHCSLLMEIVGQQGDRLVVWETNKNARALFWKPNSAFRIPEFYATAPYNRPAFLNSCDRGLPHLSGWEGTFSNYIEGHTGVRRVGE